MDFSSLMSAQIAKAGPPPTQSATKATYQKRSDVEAAREASYREEQERIETERRNKAEKKRKHEEEEAEKRRDREAKRQRLAEEARQRQQEEDEQEERERRKRLGLPELPAKEDKAVPESSDGAEDLPDEELVAKLRAMGEPARVFAESHAQRLKRYSKLLAPSKSQRQKSDQPIYTTLEPVAPEDMFVGQQPPSNADTNARRLHARRLASWFNMVLSEWAIALARRDSAVKATFSGQAATNSHTQALAHLRPLFHKLEQFADDPSVLPPDLLNPFTTIVHDAQNRRYVAANDGYLQLSIGKAAWPIGVTMVGIHERSAREKLHESETGKAHIMSDESTRKILQSLKRCLTFAQTRWPPEDVGQLMG